VAATGNEMPEEYFETAETFNDEVLRNLGRL